MSGSKRSQSRTTRNIIERERRSQMKNLYTTLSNLLPPHPSKLSVRELVEYATVWVEQQQKRIKELKELKVQLEKEASTARSRIRPVINITYMDSIIGVNLMAGNEMKFAICDVISILEEEGAQVLCANYKNEGNDKFLLSIHSQMIAYPTRIGFDNSRVHERLKMLQSSWENSWDLPNAT